MILTDCHTHTNISPDGSGTVEEMCKKAQLLNLDALAITEHCEINRFFSPDYYGETPRNEFEVYFDGNVFENAMKTISAAKENFPNLNLIAGIELGQINAAKNLTEILISDKRLDFVIASLHELIGMEDFAFLDYKNIEDCEKLLDEYFKQLLEIAESGLYDVLGHITYPLRYMTGECCFEINLKKYENIIEKIFKAVIKNGKGIEVNTSGLRQKYGKTFPHDEILHIYHELGGEILTTGSDAHNSKDLAKGIQETTLALKKMGFKKICYFKKHIPFFLDI